METSRDDFVIAIRSAFLKKETQQKFSILTLIIFSIIFLILGEINFKPINYIKIAIKEIAYRSSFIVSGPEKIIGIGFNKITNHINHYSNYKNIKEFSTKFNLITLSPIIILIILTGLAINIGTSDKFIYFDF